eukprot:gene9524-19804_t
MRSSKSSSLKLQDVENLFIEKLQEKYRLTERDLKKAFTKYDTNGSGYLESRELAAAINHFLNGVNPEIVNELVKHYDIDGDGLISVSEFAQFLSSRNKQDQSEWITIDHLVSPSPISSSKTKNSTKRLPQYEQFEEYEPDDRSDILSPQELTKVEVAVVARSFLQNLRSMILKRGSELRKQGKIPLHDRLTMHSSQIAEEVAKYVLQGAFNTFTRTSKDVDLIDYQTFVLEYLFQCCCDVVDNNVNKMKTHGKNNNKHTTTSNTKIPLTDENIQRPEVCRGPVSKPTVSHALLTNTNVKAAKGSTINIEVSDIPLRFVTRRCRTSLAVPTGFDRRLLARSAERPAYQCIRDHIFGMNVAPYSGNALYSLSGPAVAELGMEVVVYAAAAVGIFHDISTG